MGPYSAARPQYLFLPEYSPSPPGSFYSSNYSFLQVVSDLPFMNLGNVVSVTYMEAPALSIAKSSVNTISLIYFLIHELYEDSFT